MTDEMYLMEYSPSFDPRLMVRIWKTASGCYLMANSDFILHPWEQHRELTGDEWDSLKNDIDRAEFWQMPIYDGKMGFDGFRLTITGHAARRYRTIDRWCPSGPFLELGQYIARLAGAEIPE
jgi:hypothetical protein